MKIVLAVIVNSAVLVLAATSARAGEPAPGPRLWAGAGVALDPAFAVAAMGADWFVSGHWGLGLAGAHTVGIGDRRAIENGYGFATALARFRAAVCPGARIELAAGGGIARTRFGSPGARSDIAPALAVGTTLAVALPVRLEIALEAQSHIVFSERAGTRNPAHTSEVITLGLRWGASR